VRSHLDRLTKQQALVQQVVPPEQPEHAKPPEAALAPMKPQTAMQGFFKNLFSKGP